MRDGVNGTPAATAYVAGSPGENPGPSSTLDELYSLHPEWVAIIEVDDEQA